MSLLQNHETHNRQFTFVIFVTSGGLHGGRHALMPTAVQRWEEIETWVFVACGWECKPVNSPLWE
jgi:hypothetical protein